ncbi:MATE family efflux transporter [Parashewanella spongiae]|uniref:MATE family efflux transporter n=1 Tax=Parashewanella spongiae TaxID=342950 RepID=A0A3A6UNH2_9GAMM|nr:MATE family efflux transporter [Parashewanella spongiae]MCL1077201.1 MATE family efflux transporter [Parashewanella spongiae]RJY19355.1 MATE family efflux transporter [Parashewanella spongiae]
MYQLLFSKQHNQRLWSLALPIIISNISVPLLGLVDTAMIGHLSAAYYLGGVALGSTIISMSTWLLGFLRMSTTGLTAQAHGQQDVQEQCKLLVQGAVLAFFLGLIVVLLQKPMLSMAMSLSAASEQVEFYCRQYVSIRIWSMPIVLLNLVMLGWLLGRRLPSVAMWQLIIANSVNIVLDAWFILGLGWDVAGAAWASVGADITAFLVATFMVYRQLSALRFNQFKLLIKQVFTSGYQKIISLNANIFIRSLCLQLTLTFMTFYAAIYGDSTLAANAVLLNLLMLISYGLDGIAYYAEVEVGQAYGKRAWVQLREAVVLSWFWSAVMAIIFALLFLSFGSSLVSLLTNITKVKYIADQYLIWLALMPLWSFGCYLFDGVYIGAAKGAQMRNSMIFSTVLVFFPFWYVLQDFGNHSLWAALSAFMLSRSATLGIHFVYQKGFQNESSPS